MLQRVTKMIRERRIPYAISRRMSRNPEKSWFWKMARCFYTRPARFFELTGCFPLPLQTTDFTEFNPQSFAAVEPVAHDDVPPCPHPHNDWQRWTTGLPESLRDPGIPSCHLVSIPGGYADATGNVFSAEGKLVVGAALAFRKDVNSYYVPSRIYPPTARVASAAAVTSSQQDNYYHWLMEVLPRVHMLRATGRMPAKLYIHSSKRFQRESLEILGINIADTIDPARYDLVQARDLIVPFHEIKAGKQHPLWVTQFLRETFLSNVKTDSATPGRRLYISRAGAAWRSVINEDEVLAELAKYGFAVTTLAGLSLREQVALFSQAEILIAPHGAAMANLVFSSPGTKVIEFQPCKLQDTYFRLCRTGQLPYYYIKSATGPENPVNNQQNLTIDISHLHQALAWAGVK